MDNRLRYKRTDLASECKTEDIVSGTSHNGIAYKEMDINGFKLSLLDIIDSRGEDIIGKPSGRYVTIDVGKVWTMSDTDFETCASLLSDQLSQMLERATGGIVPESVLVVGLGNRYITSDALGHETLKNVIVTRHIKGHDEKLYASLGGRSVCAIAPGVIGQTGIESLELIRGAAIKVCPQAIIVIDALAAVELSHLATTVQITDTGIAPGSGIGNRRMRIDKESLGCPVIAIGVPTVVESSTLVYGALEEAGISDIDKSLIDVLENGRGFFVTPKESDIVNTEVSRLLAEAINLALA